MRIDISLWGFMLLFLCAAIISLTIQRKQLESDFKETTMCKDEILKEFKNIRHEYNNMLQSLICLIEEEDMEGLLDYKEKLLEKTQCLNGNNLTQLVKIKNKNILSEIYKILMDAKEAGIIVNLSIFDDIEDMHIFKVKLCKELCGYLNYAYLVATKNEEQINLKISANDLGISFVFENIIPIKYEELTSNQCKTKADFKVNKNIYFNTLIKNSHLTQEILVCYKD